MTVYFGAEADDPMTAWAFRDPHQLHPLFNSDVSHFDVTDMTEVLEEAWELIEHEMITAGPLAAPDSMGGAAEPLSRSYRVVSLDGIERRSLPAPWQPVAARPG